MEEAARKVVNIYISGMCVASSESAGPGGWASVLRYGSHRKELSGSMPKTTPLRMEIFALISALGQLKTPCNCNIFSNSGEIVRTLKTHSLERWEAGAWKENDRAVENQDYWKLLSLVIRKKSHRLRAFPYPAADSDENSEKKLCEALERDEIRRFLSINPDLGDADAFTVYQVE